MQARAAAMTSQHHRASRNFLNQLSFVRKLKPRLPFPFPGLAFGSGLAHLRSVALRNRQTAPKRVPQCFRVGLSTEPSGPETRCAAPGERKHRCRSQSS